MIKRRIVSILLVGLLLTGCQSEEQEITISAAASLIDVLEEVIDLFEQEHPSIQVSVNLGGSGSLSQQIIQGAPVDVFLSASIDKFEQVRQEGLMDEEFIEPLMMNKLVWIQAKDTSPLKSIEQINKLAIGTPETVPAGQYAKEAFTDSGIFTKLESKLVYTKDVRQVLQYVESENVDTGIVYQTDAKISDKVNINHELPLGEYDPIIYPVGILKNSQQKEAAKTFYQFLQTEEVIELFKQYGFLEVDGDIDGSIFSTN
ncbi:molybdate ABC transporter substrate-binding protein [Gracilibacillus massiliensis]|uniref:molybdate ABC transporter substrate-binding protein n=1 Tax=Gracilibacillus massiliensis TaxID=1564956 RepID=UPI00071D16A3|nr:molybdate ABC transporter substrate-binding protein [Gracilibacillus massiliensis]